MRTASGALANKKVKLALLFTRLQQFVARLLREDLEIQNRSRIGRDDVQRLSAVHSRQGLFGTQDRQRTVQATSIQFLIEFNHKLTPRLSSNFFTTTPIQTRDEHTLDHPLDKPELFGLLPNLTWYDE